jgi:ketosteroid isomerase-like protein
MSNLIHYIQNEFDAIWNTNNLEAVMERFTDDAVVRSIPPLPGAPDQFVGKAQIRGFVQMLMVNFHVESKNFQQDGDRVTWFATVTSDSIRGMGVDSMDADCEAVVQNGKIKSFTPAFTQETLARLAAAADKS